MHVIPTSIILFAAILYVLRYFRPFGNDLAGERVFARPVPLIARLRMHVVPMVVGTVIAALLSRIASSSAWTIALPFVVFLVLLALPMSYTLTTEGLRLGYGTFRRWTEFAGAIRYRGGAKLQGANGRRGMRIWLGGGLGDDEFLLMLRRAIRDAYKGGEPAATTRIASTTHAVDETSSFHAPA